MIPIPLSSNAETRAVAVYAIHADTVRKTDWAPIHARMPGRMEKARRFHFERDRLLCVGAGLLLLQYVGIRGESELRIGEYGKPYAPGYPGFNLSHSGEWCVLAVGADDVGVDIEKLDGSNLRVAPMVFTAAEQKWMEADPVQRFHVLWTMKESVMKAAGLGVNLEPGGFEVLPFLRGAPVSLLGRSWYAACGALADCRYSVCAPCPIKATINIV